jgi:alpha-1,3-rhamnosyl/mannosyltransferase
VQVSRAPWLGDTSERAVLETEVAEWRADVFHGVFPPHVLDHTPSIVTLFDVTPLTHPTLHRDDVRGAFEAAWQRLQLAPTGSAVPVSRATRAAARRFGVTATEVIGIGLPDAFLAGPPATGPRAGVLCVGTLEPRKNLPLLLEATDLLARRGAAIDLTVVGKSGWGDVSAAIRPLAARATFRGFVDDAALLDGYASHAIVACPSSEEGFGLPVLEAMALGALPLVSPAPALAELVGDPRLTVPLQPEAWADRIHWWLTHEDERARVCNRLAQRARARHGWAAIADAWLRRYARMPRSAHA